MGLRMVTVTVMFSFVLKLVSLGGSQTVMLSPPPPPRLIRFIF